jgi:hypothetical protein
MIFIPIDLQSQTELETVITQETNQLWLDTWEGIRDTMQDIFDVFCSALQRVVEVFQLWLIHVRRIVMYFRLVKRHVPRRFAVFIAEKWPARWLPNLTPFELVYLFT